MVNEGEEDKKILVRQRIVDKEKKLIGEAEEEVEIRGGGKVCVRQGVMVKEPRLWSVERPEMYWVETIIKEKNLKFEISDLRGDRVETGVEEVDSREEKNKRTSNIQHSTFNIERREETGKCKVEIANTKMQSGREEKQVLDRVETGFGYREFRFDAEKGFFLNGKAVKILGTCNHQDHAGVGAAVPDAIWAYRVRRLKAMGSNGYRCAHNPPAPEFWTRATGWGCWCWMRIGSSRARSRGWRMWGRWCGGTGIIRACSRGVCLMKNICRGWSRGGGWRGR